MTALFGQIMEQLNSSVVVLLAILILSACAAVKLGRLLEKFAQHERRLERADDTHDLLVKLAAKVEYIYEFTNPRSVARSQSPLALTPLGQEIAPDTNADAMYEAHKGVLLGNIEMATLSEPMRTISKWRQEKSQRQTCQDFFRRPK